MRWKFKAVAQRIFSYIPGGENIYYGLQENIGGFHNFSVESKVGQALRLLNALSSADCDLSEKCTFEVGTGWTPIVPMLFYLYGQRKCISIDVNRYLKNEITLKSVRQIVELDYLRTECAALIPDALFESRLSSLRDVSTTKELFHLMNFQYSAPLDARETSINSNTFDIVFSNTTLEHIPVPEIPEIFAEALRLLKPGGIMVHLIDMSDHYSHADRSISSINYLRYSNTEWTKFNSKFLYQNRLRASDYRKLTLDAGFEIVFWNPKLKTELIREAHSLPLHIDFADLSDEDICSSSLVVVARKGH